MHYYERVKVSDRNLLPRRELVAEVEAMFVDLNLHQPQLPLQLLLLDNIETPVTFDIYFPFLLTLQLFSALTEHNINSYQNTEKTSNSK